MPFKIDFMIDYQPRSPTPHSSVSILALCWWQNCGKYHARETSGIFWTRDWLLMPDTRCRGERKYQVAAWRKNTSIVRSFFSNHEINKHQQWNFEPWIVVLGRRRMVRSLDKRRFQESQKACHNISVFHLKPWAYKSRERLLKRVNRTWSCDWSVTLFECRGGFVECGATNQHGNQWLHLIHFGIFRHDEVTSMNEKFERSKLRWERRVWGTGFNY